MRVAIVTESFAPSVNGVARSVAHVTAHLEDRGHDALVICPGRGPDRVGGTEVVRLPAVPLPWCPDFPLGVPTATLRQALEAFRPDVVHLASPIAVGARAAVVARDLRIPTVAIYQTDVAGFAEQYGWRRAGRPLWRWLAWLHGNVDRTLAPSRAAVADLEAHDIPDVHRWGRGVDVDAFAPHHRTRPPTGEVRRVRVGYVGRLAAEKRVDRLAHVADLPGVELVVVGDGAERRRLERLLPTATFTGALEGPELSRAFADLDVFVHTGTHETFCQAAQEALASGVPVVAPAAGGLLDLVRPGRSGLLWDPGDDTSLRPAVATLVREPATRARFGTAARAQVLGRTWATLGDELLHHYRAVRGRRTLLRQVA
ncbi:glycosyltransferase family 1 protein [Nitriliruptoraceae bacterium ZYF776]|nr:glycosyltransferase family 1 protein [Profundirhabdus halotolerans]